MLIKIRVLNCDETISGEFVAAGIEVMPPTYRPSSSDVFTGPDEVGAWRITEIANSDAPPSQGRFLVALSPVGKKGDLYEGVELKAEVGD